MRALLLLLAGLLFVGYAGAAAPLGVRGVSDEGPAVRLSKDTRAMTGKMATERDRRLAAILILTALGTR